MTPEMPKDAVMPPPEWCPSGPHTADFGLVVGVDEYPWYRLLRGAVRDAERFYRWLLDPNGGDIPEPRARRVISCLKPLRPLKEQVDHELEQIATAARALGGGRRLYFHFSGHGIGIDPDDTALLLAEWSLDRLAHHGFALSTHAYRGNLVKMGLFDEIVILLDCCRTTLKGAVASSLDLDLSSSPDPHCVTEYFVAYATTLGGAAWERRTPQWEGAFTRRLLRILRGRSGLTATELKTALKEVSHGESQRAQVVSSISDDSRFGRPGLTHPFQITFSEARLGKRVRIAKDVGRGQYLPAGSYDVPAGSDHAAPWQLNLAGGLYMLDDGDSKPRVIDYPEQLLDDDQLMTSIEF